MPSLLQSLKILILAIILSIGVTYVYAWTGPTAAAPGGNTPAPLNTGIGNQTKTGGLLNVFNLWVDAALGVTGGATFGGNVGIGTASPTQRLEVVGGSIKATGGLIIESRTSDPVNPAVGQIWMRTDF